MVSATKAFEDLITIDIPEVNELGGNLWGLDNIGVPEIWAETNKKESILGEGVTIAVVDTGIDLDHKEFKGRIVDGYDFIDDDIFADDLNTPRQISETGNGYIIVGSKKGDKIYALFDDDSDGYAEKRVLIAEGLQNPTLSGIHI